MCVIRNNLCEKERMYNAYFTLNVNNIQTQYYYFITFTKLICIFAFTEIVVYYLGFCLLFPLISGVESNTSCL